MKENNCGDSRLTIYGKILENIGEDGALHDSFALEGSDDDSIIKFAHGAMDGIIFYHSAGGGGDEEMRTLLTGMITSASEGRVEEAFNAAHDYALKGHALGDIDFLQQDIIHRRESLNHNNLMHLAATLTTEGTKAEAVKLGLSMLEIYDLAGDEELLEPVRKLSLCDEFTLFGGFVLSKQPNGNEELFRLLPKVRSWGRVHLVRMIEADTPEIKDWLLLNGVENDILSAYSGLDCFEKVDYMSRLKDADLDLEHYRGLAHILEAMTDEGPAAGLSCVDDLETVAKTFARVTMARKDLEFEDYSALVELGDYLERESGSEEGNHEEDRWKVALKAETDDFLSSDTVWGSAIAAIKAGKGFSLAKRLGIPYFEQAYQVIEKAPVDNSFLASELMAAGYKAEALVKLYSETLDLEKLCTGADREMGFGDDFAAYRTILCVLQGLKGKVGLGESFIYSVLASPVINNRNAAIAVIESWLEAEQRPLSQVSPGLSERVRTLLPQEVDEDVKGRLEKLAGKYC